MHSYSPTKCECYAAAQNPPTRDSIQNRVQYRWMHAKAEANIAEGVLGWSSKAQELFIKVVIVHNTLLYSVHSMKKSPIYHLTRQY